MWRSETDGAPNGWCPFARPPPARWGDRETGSRTTKKHESLGIGWAQTSSIVIKSTGHRDGYLNNSIASEFIAILDSQRVGKPSVPECNLLRQCGPGLVHIWGCRAAVNRESLKSRHAGFISPDAIRSIQYHIATRRILNEIFARRRAAVSSCRSCCVVSHAKRDLDRSGRNRVVRYPQTIVRVFSLFHL